MQRDWRNLEDYVFTQDLTPELWAWQFLRRNPEYRKDYDWFITTWRSLEADYGVAPERNFSRWKLDERAYAPETMTQNFCDDDKSCASPDGDKVMIECAMGAKWGFYKFPNSPDVEFPEVPEKLIWRELDISVSEPAEKAELFDMDFRFDLRLPLSEQLSSAKRKLIAGQRRFQRQGGVFTITKLTSCLRLLDAGKHASEEIIETLFQGDIQNYESHRAQAMSLCNADYGLLRMVNIK